MPSILKENNIQTRSLYPDHQSSVRVEIKIFSYMGGGGSQKITFPCIISLKTNKDVFQITKRANQRGGLPGTQETGYPAPEKVILVLRKMARSKAGMTVTHQVERAICMVWTDWRLEQRFLQKGEIESPSDTINIRRERDKCVELELEVQINT